VNVVVMAQDEALESPRKRRHKPLAGWEWEECCCNVLVTRHSRARRKVNDE